MESLSYDVVIVGARVAGSVLAGLLGDSRLRVLLVDKARFPSSTISTHFFRGRAMLDVANRLGILPEVMSHGSPPLVYTYDYKRNAAEPSPNIYEENFGTIGHNLSMRREVFDEILVRRASRNANVTLMENTVATGLIEEDGHVCGVSLASDGAELEARCRLLVGADGVNSRIAQWVKAADEIHEPGYRGIFYCYVRGFQGPLGVLDGMEFSQWGDEAAYVFPSDHGVTCLALTLNLEQYGWMRKGAKKRFWQRMKDYACFEGRLSGLKIVGPPILGCGPVPNYMRVPNGPGWALVGDAGMHIDPWAGLGMDNASTHASVLADSLLDFSAGRCSLEEALASYHHQRNEASNQMYRNVVDSSRDLRSLDSD